MFEIRDSSTKDRNSVLLNNDWGPVVLHLYALGLFPIHYLLSTAFSKRRALRVIFLDFLDSYRDYARTKDLHENFETENHYAVIEGTFE